MSTARAHEFLLRLLFDEDLRERFFEDRLEATLEEGLTEDERTMFDRIDRHGLELDAAMRRTYLMSALCRSYPLSAAALGSLPRGPESLSAFLASPKLLGETSVRTEAFGEHLTRLVEMNASGASPVLLSLVGALLSFERGVASEAARVRRAVEDGGEAPEVEKPTASSLRTRAVVLPPHLVVAELPVPLAVVRTALDHVGPEDAWHRIAAGRLSSARLMSAARADPMPITLLARAVVRGPVLGRGAGGVAPLVEVSFITAELAGRRAASLGAVDGTKKLDDFPAPDRSRVKHLLDAGLLALA